jgi:hypothetical protein
LNKARKVAKSSGQPLDARQLSPEAAQLLRQQRGLDRAWDVDRGATAPAIVDVK